MQTKQVLDRILKLCTNRGFAITGFHCSNDFRKLKDHSVKANMDIVGRGGHVPTIKRSIRTIKERCRSMTASLPFSHYPKAMTKGLVERAMEALSKFLNKRGMSNKLSPHTIMTGRGKTDYSDIKLAFGEHFQVFLRIKNNLESRIEGAIVL